MGNVNTARFRQPAAPTDVADPSPGTLHELFEAQAARTPDAVAVTWEDASLTYRELNERANRLAHHLRGVGIGPETLVALCVERSFEMVVGILGVLKAGGAYLPLDLAYPKERLAFMLADAGVQVLLTQTALQTNLPPVERVICLDGDQSAIAVHSAHNPPAVTGGEHLAYIIYTSGSTGKPKGCQITHHNVVRLFRATDHWYGFSSADVWTLFHSYAFDFSVWEIWGALLYGGRLVVVPYLVSRNPAAFYELLGREQVTVLNQTPSAFRQLIWAEQSAATPAPLALRYIIFGGEALELSTLQPWFDRHGDHQPRLINMYGITETTVHVTYRPITSADVAAGTGSVIGVPIPDLQIFVLDEHRQPVPPGTTGELYVGGAGLARGYLHRPELTAQRFLTQPPHGRLYRTGDLARVLPDGDLEYLGRCDDQVKIRGFRIELGEIQAVLNRQPAVRDSYVLAAAAGAGDQRLLAYIVLHPGRTVSTSELRTFLQRDLPEYMVPASFQFLPALPLSPNGKVDRHALPAPDSDRPALHNEFIAPATPAEQTLAAIWSAVLDVRPVGIHDSFFELGGDSIRAIQVLARAQAQGLPATLAQLFATPTIHGLAQHTGAGPTGAGPGAAFELIAADDRHRLPAGLDDAYPATLLQAGMFYHNTRQPASAVYHDVFSFRITFPFLPDKLQTVLQQLTARHPTLRTAFDLVHYSEPLQLVQKSVTVPFAVEDLRALTAAEQTQRLTAWIATEKYRAFDRTVAPLLRVHVQWYSAEQFQLIVSFHHAILDGWSLAVMLTEVLQEYAAQIKGAGTPLTAPALPYRAYVALERQAVANAESRQFWVGQLAGAAGSLLPRWPQSYRAGGTEQARSAEFHIPAALYAGLKQLAQSAQVPLKSVLQAAHYRVLSLIHGQPDVISGAITNGRPEALDGERMIGLFLNTVPLRLQLTGGSWRELCQQVFAAERALLPHRRLPLAEIQALAGGQTLFESAFDFVHFHVYRDLQGYQDMGFMEGHYFEANSFILFTTFMVDVTTTALQFHMDYDPAELSGEQIQAFGEYYANTLAAMVAEPAGRYELFSPLPPAERQKLFVAWNATDRAWPQDQCLHELFEAQAARCPDAVAVICGHEALTYAVLNRRANQLAHRLRAMGVGPEVLVGLCVERSAAMITAMLAIHKAGGAYVPLDPAYPAEWLAFVLADTQAPVLVTESKLVAQLPPHAAQVLCLDTERGDAEPPTNLTPLARPANLAYVIYTSGSTGQPKGVAIEHHSPVALAAWAREVFSTPDMAGVLAATSICFDLSVFEIFFTLSVGGQVILAENALALPQLPAANAVTLINTVPSAIQELLDQHGLPTSVRVVNLAGEPTSVALVQRLYQQPHVQKVYDLYGPSETTTYSTFALRQADGPATIGRPIANTQIYLLDGAGQPVPVGTPGELFIGGAGVARGYLNRPDLTAEKFVVRAGARLYRTGDLAKYRPDGNLEFLGRGDRQVKLRGFRIELGEIEAVLRGLTGVRDAVVVTRDEDRRDRRLVAYLVSNNGPLTAAELRRQVRAKLPEYMVPAAFVTLDSFPLTPNGKVDRRALPADDGATAERTYEPPATPTEDKLAGIWAGLLQVEPVGRSDDFFSLGGHSLLAMRVLTRVRQAWGVELALRGLFENPTVRALATHIDALRDAKDRHAPVTTDPTPGIEGEI